MYTKQNPTIISSPLHFGSNERTYKNRRKIKNSVNNVRAAPENIKKIGFNILFPIYLFVIIYTFYVKSQVKMSILYISVRNWAYLSFLEWKCSA